MELWVVAAATGAATVAKYWQQFTSKEQEGSSEPASDDLLYGQSDSRKLFHRLKDQALPLPRLGKKKKPGREDVWDNGYFPELSNDRSGGVGGDETGIASTSGAVVDGNVLSLMNLSTGVCGNENLQGIGYGDKRKSEFPTGETGSIRISRHRKVRDRSVGYFAKPMNSLESCLTAQLYKEHAGLEQYVYSSVPSPSISTVRPLLVTNGRQIISRASSEVRRDSGLEEKETHSRMGSIELPRRSKASFAKQRRSSRFSISTARPSEGPYHSQGSSSNGMLLFFLGITIGIMSTVVTNQREMDKLNELLKQSENLVQDLHEELEMREFSTMKELTSKDLESLTTDKLLSERNPGKPTNNDDDKGANDNKTEKTELMNRIEAELEAELEKLELSMKTSRLERISKLTELDPGFVASVQGELETNNVNKQGLYDADPDASEASTTEPHPSNYSVPPMELSLRLHELIKSRLEARIMELEAALETSEHRRHSMEPDHAIPRRMLYSDSDQSLSTRDEGSDIDQPVVMNLSGEALDAYNEAYEEMYRMVEETADAPLETIRESEHNQKETNPENEMSSLHQNDEERRTRDLLLDKLRVAEEKMAYRSWGSNGLRESKEEEEEEDDDDEDEIEKLLIKQIVERTKQDSHGVLNVQQMLYSMKDQ